MAESRDDLMRCRVTTRVRRLNGVPSGEEVILSRGAAVKHARLGRVEILGLLEPTPSSSEEE